MALSKRKFEHHNTVQNLLGGETQQRTRSTISEEFVHHILESLTNNYQNPIEGLVRETISNAIDATRLLPEDQQRPVEVITPSTYNMQFTVIDHGVGMDLETLSENYVQFGRSTKLDDFSQTGSFGMGAKAPLAYTNEFKAVSVKDGVKTHYLVQRNSDGIWGNVLKTEKTNESNGTTVTVSLESQYDIESFRLVTERYLNNSYDLPILVDGKTSNFFDNYLEVSEILMDAESNTYGRVWMNRTSFYRFMNPVYRGDTSSLKVKYLVTGWDYPLFGRENNETDAFVELKPGLVTFNQSRDSIIDNIRSQRLQNIVQDHLFNNEEAIRESMIRAFNAISTSEAHKVLQSVNKMMQIRTPRAEHNVPVNDNSAVLVYNKGMVRSSDTAVFTFTAGELQNTDGNAVFELLLTRERGEQLHYPFMVSDRQYDGTRSFDATEGGYGRAWETRNDIIADEFSSQENPMLLPSYSYFSPDGHRGSQRSTALKYYNEEVRDQYASTALTIQHVDQWEDVSALLAVVNAEDHKIRTLVRQRDAIATLLTNSGVTTWDGSVQTVDPFEKAQIPGFRGMRQRLMIAYISEEDIEDVQAMKNTKVVVVDHDDLRSDLREYSKKLREENKLSESSVELELLERSFLSRKRTVSLQHIVGKENYTLSEVAQAAIISFASGDHSALFTTTESRYNDVTLKEFQEEKIVGMLTSTKETYYNSFTTRNADAEEFVKYLIHAANRGLHVDDEFSVNFFDERTFSAAEQKFIHENVENIFVSSSWSYRAKISDTLREERMVQGEVLHSLLDEFTNQEFASILSEDVGYFTTRLDELEVFKEATTSHILKDELQHIDDVISELKDSKNVKAARAMNRLAKQWGSNDLNSYMTVDQREAIAPALNRIKHLVRSFETVKTELGKVSRQVRYNLMDGELFTQKGQEKMEAMFAYQAWESLGFTSRNDTKNEGENFFHSAMLKDAFTKHITEAVEREFQKQMEEADLTEEATV